MYIGPGSVTNDQIIGITVIMFVVQRSDLGHLQVVLGTMTLSADSYFAFRG